MRLLQGKKNQPCDEHTRNSTCRLTLLYFFNINFSFSSAEDSLTTNPLSSVRVTCEVQLCPHYVTTFLRFLNPGFTVSKELWQCRRCTLVMLKTTQKFSQTKMVKDRAVVQAGDKCSNTSSCSSWLFPQSWGKLGLFSLEETEGWPY